MRALSGSVVSEYLAKCAAKNTLSASAHDTSSCAAARCARKTMPSMPLRSRSTSSSDRFTSSCAASSAARGTAHSSCRCSRATSASCCARGTISSASLPCSLSWPASSGGGHARQVAVTRRIAGTAASGMRTRLASAVVPPGLSVRSAVQCWARACTSKKTGPEKQSALEGRA